MEADQESPQGTFYPYHRFLLALFDNLTGFGGNGDWVPGNFTHPAACTAP